MNTEAKSIFNIVTVNQLMEEAAQQPDPKYLYDTLILEGEVTAIFGDTNSGKSVFTVQIADAISKIIPTLYVDLEMSAKQFQRRYTNNDGKCYTFKGDLSIANFSDSIEINKNLSFEDSLIQEMEQYIANGFECITLDNMSMLYQGDTDKSKYVAPFIAKLKGLCKSHNITLILIDHTKKRDNYSPITLNDLNGSKMKSNLVDNVICIGRSSQGEDIRYVKQLKVRSSEMTYTEENVAVYRIEKNDTFLGFTYLYTDNESNHLQKPTKVDKTERNAEILRLHKQGMPNTKIAEEISSRYDMKFSESAVRKIIKQSEGEL